MTALAPSVNGPWYSEDALRGTDEIYRSIVASIIGKVPRYQQGVFLGSSHTAFNCLTAPEPTDLHVASDVDSAPQVLHRTLLWALAHGVPFAFANSPDALRWVNSRSATPACAGRFIALRPDDSSSSALDALHEALRPFRGPLPPGSAPIASGSIIHRNSSDSVPVPVDKATEKLGIKISERIIENIASAVFSGVDLRTGEQVVVKFSRRGISTSASEPADAATLRRHDHALRSEIDGAFDCPRALALLELPEGVVTVENKIEGVPLAVLIRRRNPLYREYGSGPSNPVSYARLMCRTMVSLLEVLTGMHESGIAHGDITPANILLKTDRTGPVRPVLIDFELAVGRAGERPARGRTPGYGPKWTPHTRPSMVASDLFAFGRVVLASFAMVQNLGEIDTETMIRVFRGTADLFGIPEWAADAMGELLRQDEPDEDDRATWFATLRALLDHLSHGRRNRPADRSDVVMPSCEAIATQILRSADNSSPNRLFPGPLPYAGSGSSLGHGSAGVLWALHQCGAELPPEWIRWTIRHADTFGVNDQDLRDGMTGLIWSVSELADPHQWENLLSLAVPLSACDHMPPSTAAELAALHLKLEAGGFTGAAAPHLIRRACDGLRADAPSVSAASTLLFAYHRFADASYLQAGLRQARSMLEASLGPGRRQLTTASLLTGSAGALAVGVRYAALVSDERMLRQCHEIGAAAAAAHPLLVGIDNGLAGLGLALLDCRDFSGDASYDPLVADVARKLAEMTVPTVNGPSFPGPTLMRLSNDYATGAAGALLFFHRLALGTRSVTHPILAAVDAVATDPRPGT